MNDEVPYRRPGLDATDGEVLYWRPVAVGRKVEAPYWRSVLREEVTGDVVKVPYWRSKLREEGEEEDPSFSRDRSDIVLFMSTLLMVKSWFSPSQINSLGRRAGRRVLNCNQIDFVD